MYKYINLFIKLVILSMLSPFCRVSTWRESTWNFKCQVIFSKFTLITCVHVSASYVLVFSCSYDRGFAYSTAFILERLGHTLSELIRKPIKAEDKHRKKKLCLKKEEWDAIKEQSINSSGTRRAMKRSHTLAYYIRVPARLLVQWRNFKQALLLNTKKYEKKLGTIIYFIRFPLDTLIQGGTLIWYTRVSEWHSVGLVEM